MNLSVITCRATMMTNWSLILHEHSSDTNRVFTVYVGNFNHRIDMYSSNILFIPGSKGKGTLIHKNENHVFPYREINPFFVLDEISLAERDFMNLSGFGIVDRFRSCMRYHVYNHRDATKPLLSLPTKGLVFHLSGLIYQRWEYFLSVDSVNATPIYEWSKCRFNDGAIDHLGPRVVRDESLLSTLDKLPRPMRNYPIVKI